jgi:CRP-like cAMP-binding protein
MSLLTGDPRTATVVARTDVRLLEVGAAAFKAYVTRHPSVIDQLAAAAADRRRELDVSRQADAEAHAVTRQSLVDRMRRFFGLD